MTEDELTLDYISQFRNSNEEALAYVRKYFSSDFTMRLLSCVVRVGGVGVICGLAASVIDRAPDFAFDGQVFMLGFYCGLVAFLFLMLASRALLPIIRRALYNKIQAVFPDENVRLMLSGSTISWHSASMNIAIPIEALIAIRRSAKGVTIGIGGAWSKFIPASAFPNASVHDDFLRRLKRNLSPAALERSAEAFHGVGA